MWDQIGAFSLPRLVGFVLLCLFCCSSTFAATPQQVDAAITRGRDFLLKQQRPDGRWEKDPKRVGKAHDWKDMQGDTWGGFTAVATYALLAVGVNPQETSMQNAVNFLRQADILGIYALGIRANVWKLIPEFSGNREWREQMIHKDRDLILNGMITKEGPAEGMWDYGNGSGLAKIPRIDHSVSQYGVLGLWACEQEGAEVPIEVWQDLDRHWKADEFPDGAWSYDSTPSIKGRSSRGNISPAMTAAGIATLFITQDYIYEEQAFACKGNISNPNIDKGLEWMAQNFDQVNNAYALYGVERIGVASGRKYFGDVDWFQHGADDLVKSQAADGSWSGGFPGSTPIPTTAFALLFLARGRAPVAVNKLQYFLPPNPAAPTTQPAEGAWDQRPRDVANIVRWTGDETANDLNWQSVNLHSSAIDLAEAPVLYISGNTDLNFTPEELQKLRDFVWFGGMILGNADCADGRFVNSFEKLGETLFGREFRELPAGHPIFNEVFPARKWKSPPSVLGLSNGIRELMVILPQADPARAWQVRATETRKELFQVGTNILEYAVDKKWSVKGVTHLVLPDPKIIPDRTLKLARLQYDGNWDPEPGAWQRMAAVLHNQAKVDLIVTPVKLGAGTLAGFPVAHLTGTAKFKLTDDQELELLEWINRGGTLIVDAGGGSSDFADSAEGELRTIFGADADKGLDDTLTPDHPMFGLPNLAIESIYYRPYARTLLVGSANAPRIRAIEHAGRVAVFYSREDLTEGMVGENVDGVYGYEPETATNLMRNMVLYAGFNHRRPLPRAH
jgi:hypothetical protein